MEPDRLLHQTIADRYRIHRAVGEDALGWVMVGRDRQTQRQVGVRVVRPELIARAPVHFDRTSALAAALEHPNSVRVLHHAVGADGVGLRVTEWDRGGTLGGALVRRPLLSSSVAWALDVAEALAAAHAIGLLHRGLGPHAIRLVRGATPPDRARLDDWGLGALLDDGRDSLTSTGLTYTGGAPWMPPELIRDRAYDARSELYALGAVLYRCVTGEPPFTGPGLKVLAAHVHTDPVPPSQQAGGVPHWLDELVMALLAKAPEDRPESAAAVAQALRDGASSLADGAAHPERVTASVAPTRLPRQAIRGVVAHHPAPETPTPGTRTPLHRDGWASRGYAVPAALVVALIATAVAYLLW